MQVLFNHDTLNLTTERKQKVAGRLSATDNHSLWGERKAITYRNSTESVSVMQGKRQLVVLTLLHLYKRFLDPKKCMCVNNYEDKLPISHHNQQKGMQKLCQIPLAVSQTAYLLSSSPWSCPHWCKQGIFLWLFFVFLELEEKLHVPMVGNAPYICRRCCGCICDSQKWHVQLNLLFSLLTLSSRQDIPHYFQIAVLK